MTDLSGPTSPRQQRLQRAATAEAGMHTRPSAELPSGRDGDGQHGSTGDTHGQLAMAARRFLHDRMAIIGFVIFFGLAIAALLTGWFWEYSYTTITDTLNAPPSLSRPIGTNPVGGDMFAQVMHGTLQDIEIALVVAVIATVVGSVVG